MSADPTPCEHKKHRPKGLNQEGQWFELLAGDRVVERWEYCVAASLRIERGLSRER